MTAGGRAAAELLQEAEARLQTMGVVSATATLKLLHAPLRLCRYYSTTMAILFLDYVATMHQHCDDTASTLP